MNVYGRSDQARRGRRMKEPMYTGLALLAIGCLLCLFTSRESSRRLDGRPWYIAVELTTLALLVAGSAFGIVGAVGVLGFAVR